MGNVTQLKDKDGNKIYPVTSSDLVFDSRGTSIENKVNSKSDISYVDAELSKKSDIHTHPYKLDSYIPSWNEITGKPTNMPANGGNADTVDGKHANEFSLVDHEHESPAYDSNVIYTTSGSSNAYILDVPNLSTLHEGLILTVKFHASANSATCNININNIGNKRIYAYGTSGISNAIIANSIQQIIYSGNGFLLLGYQYASNSSTSASYATGLRIAASAYSALEDLVAGEVVYIGSDSKVSKAGVVGRSIPIGATVGTSAGTIKPNATGSLYTQYFVTLHANNPGIRKAYKDVYIEGSSINNGNLITTGNITTELTPGKSYMRIGNMLGATNQCNLDGNNRVITLDLNGNILKFDNFSFNADTLDGQRASYFATKSEVDAIRSELGNNKSVLYGELTSLIGKL